MDKLNTAGKMLCHIRQKLGRDVADNVAQQFAGQRVYIPRKQGRKFRQFSDLFGESVAELMADYAGGGELDFPSAASADALKKWAARERDLGNLSLSCNEVAKRHNISRRWAVHLRRKLLAAQNSLPKGHAR